MNDEANSFLSRKRKSAERPEQEVKIMRCFYSMLLLCCLMLSYVCSQAETASPPYDQTVQTTNSEEPPVSINVDTTQIRRLPIFDTVNNYLRQLPYVKESGESGWHIRIRPKRGNNSTLLVEREGGAVTGTLSSTDPRFVSKLSSLLEREAKWRIIRSLENPSPNSTIRIETRAVPVDVSHAGIVRDLKPDRRRLAEGQLSEGDAIVFEVRNLGTANAYITIVDLMSDGSTFQIYPVPFVPTDPRISPDGKWHRLSGQYFRITPPFGLEVFKIIATKQPIDSQVFGLRDTKASTTITPSFRNLFGKLFEGTTVSQARPFNASDWGTAALGFQVAPKSGSRVVARTETDAPKTTLHIVAIGANKYASPSIPPLLFATKDAQDFAATLARVGKDRFGKINTKLILGSDATKAKISAAFDKIINEAEPQDTFVFFYSGVGELTEGSGSLPPQFFLIPADFQSKLSNDAVPADGISAALLQSWFTKIEARHQLIVVDACRSQGAFEAFVSRISKENEALGALLPRDVVIVGNAEASYESMKTQNGFLTYTLLKALSKGVEDTGEITARRLSARAQRISTTDPALLRNLKINSYEIGGDFPLGTVVDNLPAARRTNNRHHNNVKLQESLRRLPAPTGVFSNSISASTGFADYLRIQDQQPSPQRAEPAFPTKQSSPVVRTGKDYALLIAINDYDSWTDLSNPIIDAQTIADELKNYYGFETEVMVNPTKKEILTALLRYKRDKLYADDDQLFLFFAGHGYFSEDFREGYIIARDSQVNDMVGDSYISYSVLRNIIDYIPCKHILLVLDACFSGAIDERIARRGEDPGYEDATNLQFIHRKMQLQTRRFITSGDKVYVPDGRPGQHSPFSRKLLEAFRGYGGKYGILTIVGILAQVERVIPEPRQGEWGGNQPGSDFVFIVRKQQTTTP